VARENAQLSQIKYFIIYIFSKSHLSMSMIHLILKITQSFSILKIIFLEYQNIKSSSNLKPLIPNNNYSTVLDFNIYLVANE